MTSSDRRLAPRGGPRPDRALERDACGIGFVADVTGRTDRRVVELGLQGLAKLRHRGAFAADEQTGDGAGVLFPIPAGSSRTRSAPRSVRPRDWASSCCSSATSGRRARSVRPSRMPAAVSGSASSLARGAGRSRRRSATAPRDPAAHRAGAAPRAFSGDAARSERARTGRAAAWSVRAGRATGCVRRVLLVPDRHVQGARRRGRARALLSRPPRPPARRRRSRCSTSGTRRTRPRRGSARSRSGCSATTARSTPSAGTSTGCAAARAGWARRRPRRGAAEAGDRRGRSDSAMLDNRSSC